MPRLPRILHPATLCLGPLPTFPGLPNSFARLRPPRRGRPERYTAPGGHLIEAEGKRLRFLHHQLDDLAFRAALGAEAQDCLCVRVFAAFHGCPFPQAETEFWRFRALASWMFYAMAETATEFLASQGFQLRLRRSHRTVQPALYRVMHGPTMFREFYHPDHLQGVLQAQGWPFLSGTEPFASHGPLCLAETLTLKNGVCVLCNVHGTHAHVRSPDHLAALDRVCRAVPRLPFPVFHPRPDADPIHPIPDCPTEELPLRPPMPPARAAECWAVLTDRYKTFLDRCVPDEPDPLQESIQALLCKPHRDGRFLLLQVGDGCSTEQVYVRFPDGREHWIHRRDLRIVGGRLRDVPKRGRIRMGRTSLMGAIAHGIRTGRAFRGR